MDESNEPQTGESREPSQDAQTAEAAQTADAAPAPETANEPAAEAATGPAPEANDPYAGMSENQKHQAQEANEHVAVGADASGYTLSERNKLEKLLETSLISNPFGYKNHTGAERDQLFKEQMFAQKLFSTVHSYDSEKAIGIWTKTTGGPPSSKMMEMVKKPPQAPSRESYQTLERMGAELVQRRSAMDSEKKSSEMSDMAKVLDRANRQKSQGREKISGTLMDALKAEQTTDSGMHLLRSVISGYKNGSDVAKGIREYAKGTLLGIEAKRFIKNNQLGAYAVQKVIGVSTAEQLGLRFQEQGLKPTKGPVGASTKYAPNAIMRIAKAISDLAKRFQQGTQPQRTGQQLQRSPAMMQMAEHGQSMGRSVGM